MSSPRRPTQRHKGLTLFSDEPHHKGLVHLPLSSISRHASTTQLEALEVTKNLGHASTNQLEAPKNTTAPYRVKDPRVTSQQTFTSTNPRGESKPMQPMQMARAQVLKSFTLKSHHKQLMLMGGEERKNKEELNKWNSKI